METRRAPRVNISLKVTSSINKELGQKFSLSADKAFEVDAVDISSLGMGIVAKFFLPQKLVINLEIDGKPFRLDKPMHLKGEVRYCRYIEASTYRCGVKFIDIPKEYQEKISKFIKKYERRKERRIKLSE